MTMAKKQPLKSPGPVNATNALDGMVIADKILKEYGVIGLLIGSLAKMIWHGCKEKQLVSANDVDVLVLSSGCKHHPKRYEGDIDWYISHGYDESPVNGAGTGLVIRAMVKVQYPSNPGLYIPQRGLVAMFTDAEKSIMGKTHKVVESPLANGIQISAFPIFETNFLALKFADPELNKANLMICEEYRASLSQNS